MPDNSKETAVLPADCQYEIRVLFEIDASGNTDGSSADFAEIDKNDEADVRAYKLSQFVASALGQRLPNRTAHGHALAKAGVREFEVIAKNSAFTTLHEVEPKKHLNEMRALLVEAIEAEGSAGGEAAKDAVGSKHFRLQINKRVQVEQCGTDGEGTSDGGHQSKPAAYPEELIPIIAPAILTLRRVEGSDTRYEVQEKGSKRLPIVDAIALLADKRDGMEIAATMPLGEQEATLDDLQLLQAEAATSKDDLQTSGVITCISGRYIYRLEHEADGVWRAERHWLSDDVVDSFKACFNAAIRDIEAKQAKQKSVNVSYFAPMVRSTFVYMFMAISGDSAIALDDEQRNHRGGGAHRRAVVDKPVDDEDDRKVDRTPSVGVSSDGSNVAERVPHYAIPDIHRKKESLSETLDTPTKNQLSIRAVFENAYLNGPEQLPVEQVTFLRKWSQKQEKTLKEDAKRERIASAPQRIDQLSREIFPEIAADEEVTAERLTKLFAERAQPSDGSAPVRSRSEDRPKVKELIELWQLAVGSVRMNGKDIRIDTPIRKRSHVIRVRPKDASDDEFHKNQNFAPFTFFGGPT